MIWNELFSGIFTLIIVIIIGLLLEEEYESN